VFSISMICTLYVSSPASASAWTTGLASGSSAVARGGPAPTAPTGIAANCAIPVLGNVVVVSWTAVAHASGYNVLQSSTAATGPYVVAGPSSTTSWTSPALPSGSYWFEVTALIGTNWVSVASAASAKRTITLALLCT
jgi:hypothetical protein